MSFQYLPLMEGASPPKRVCTNRRGCVRYQCGPATPGRVVVLNRQEWQRVWILDLSLSGAGLLLSRPLEAGLALVLHLKGHDKKTYQFPSHVAHASRQPDGDWVVGCKFDQNLTDEQLDELL